MVWRKVKRTNPKAREIADRHYSRQTVGADGFVPPGRCLVLLALTGPAYWVTSWPFAEYVRHEWAGAWICSAFRNEGAGLSSELITQAEQATHWYFGSPPEPHGFVTFVNRDKVRRKRDFGRCFRKAGWEEIGETKGGLLALGHAPDKIPEPMCPIGAQRRILFPLETQNVN